MPNIIRTLAAVVIALAGLVAWGTLAMAGAPDSGPNVAQVDLVNDWACPLTPPTPGTLPDLQVAITTTGGPLLVLLNLNLYNPLLDIEADLVITPVLNNTSQTGETQRIQVTHGEARPGFGALAFSRVYPVTAGSHTVRWEAYCLSQLTVLRGWLTVYELPVVKK